MQTLTLSKAAARAFLLRAFALERWQSLPDTLSAITQLEFVQEDSIPICGRMHDLILFPRVAGYRPEALAEVLYGTQAGAFEIHFPNLAALPRTDYPYFVRKMQARRTTPGRWQGLFSHEAPVAEAFLTALDKHGPLSTRHHGNDFGHMLSGWGSRATVVSQVAEKLWLQGITGIAHRKNFERYFDRLERLAPALAAWHTEQASLPLPEDATRHLARKRLRAKAIFRPKRDDRTLLGESAFCKLEIEGLSKPWYCLAEHTSLLGERAAGADDFGGEALLLAPLDPLIYDRQRTRELFDFDYTWEVYVPAERRKWGYYVLPILQGDRLIGRVDLKRESKSGTLQILALLLEPGVEESLVATPIGEALQRQATFLETTNFSLLGECPPTLRKRLAI